MDSTPIATRIVTSPAIACRRRGGGTLLRAWSGPFSGAASTHPAFERARISGSARRSSSASDVFARSRSDRRQHHASTRTTANVTSRTYVDRARTRPTVRGAAGVRRERPNASRARDAAGRQSVRQSVDRDGVSAPYAMPPGQRAFANSPRYGPVRASRISHDEFDDGCRSPFKVTRAARTLNRTRPRCRAVSSLSRKPRHRRTARPWLSPDTDPISAIAMLTSVATFHRATVQYREDTSATHRRHWLRPLRKPLELQRTSCGTCKPRRQGPDATSAHHLRFHQCSAGDAGGR